MTTPGPMARAVADALDAAPVRPEDAGAAELCRRYAALIDQATPVLAYARHLRALRTGLDPADDAAAQAFERVADALSAHSVASDLGPKLLAALTALGLTLAGRGTGKGGGPVVGAGTSEFEQRRARARAEREGRAG